MEDLNELINSDTHLVYNFGVKGAGKTCFLAVMYKYFYQKWLVQTNPSPVSIEAINRIESILEKLEGDGRMPPFTAPRSLHELDLAIKKLSSDDMKYFTFLDMAGEDLEEIFKRGELHEGNRKYLASSLNPIIICFVEYSQGSAQDRRMALFFDYLTTNEFSFSNFAMIITKWDDRNNDNMDLKDYIKLKMPQTYLRINDHNNIIDRILKFSIGEVDDNRLVGHIDTSYCEKVAEWLYQDAGTIVGSRGLSLKDLWIKFNSTRP